MEMESVLLKEFVLVQELGKVLIVRIKIVIKDAMTREFAQKESVSVLLDGLESNAN